MSTPQIEVLLATYNGAKFVREQIDSILRQDYEHVRVLARDDGSTDETRSILHEYAAAYPARFRLLPTDAASGSPKGNFLCLMQASTGPYVCFSDQDDVWLPDKLSRTMQAMDRLESMWGRHTPLLVFTDLTVVDEVLTPMYESFWARMGIDPTLIDRLSELLVQSVVTGCTTLLNRPLLQLALRMPAEARMHDRWIALLGSTMGKSGIVGARTVLYRQHDRNAVGLGVHRRSDHAGQWEVSQQQAEAFLRIHGPELPADKREVLAAYLRCQTSRSRLVRLATWLRYGFYYRGVLPNLRTVIYLWKRKVEST
jgi:glycosyltransferase involved in cell wall biosynthesis